MIKCQARDLPFVFSRTYIYIYAHIPHYPHHPLSQEKKLFQHCFSPSSKQQIYEFTEVLPIMNNLRAVKNVFTASQGTSRLLFHFLALLQLPIRGSSDMHFLIDCCHLQICEIRLYLISLHWSCYRKHKDIKLFLFVLSFSTVK